VAVRWRFQAVGRLETLPKTDVDQNFSNAAGVYKERGSQTGSKNLLGADLFSRTFCKEIVMSRSIRYALAVSLVSLFTACGGGGGGDSSTVSTLPAPVPPVPALDSYAFKTAWVNFFNDSSTLNFTVSGVISGVTISGSGAVTQSVPASATFENAAGLKKTEVTTGTVTGTLNGVVVTQPINGSVTLYVDTNYLPLGETGEDFYSVVTGPVTIPPTVKIGDAGPLYKQTVYSSSARTLPLGTVEVSYAVKPDTMVGSALLDLIEVDKNASGVVAGTSTLRFRMTPAGGLTRLSEVAVVGADTLTITY
jgi:hypothetical protein